MFTRSKARAASSSWAKYEMWICRPLPSSEVRICAAHGMVFAVL